VKTNSEIAKIVCGSRPSHREAREPPKLASVVDCEIFVVLLRDAQGVVTGCEVEGEEVVSWAGNVSQVL
jgi:hypothetical protein